MRKLLLITRRALVDMVRRPALTALTAGTVAVVFLLLGLFGLVAANLSRLAEKLEDELRVTVFLRDDCLAPCRQQLEKKLRTHQGVAALQVVDRQSALAEFRQRLGPDAALLDLLGENPLPASLELEPRPSWRRGQRLAELVAGLERLPGVEEVQYGQNWLERFFSLAGLVRALGIVLGALILLAAAVIVANTINLSVLTRRQESEILSLVGATAAFIKAPFYLQGALVGLVGAGLGLGLCYLVFALTVPWLSIPVGLGQQPLEPRFLEPETVALVVGGGALLGLAGTAAALWRHLPE